MDIGGAEVRVLFLDTEATGVNIFGGDKIFAISFATNNNKPRYIDIRTDSIRPFIKELDRADLIVAHGMKFDAHALWQIGIDLTQYNIDCTLIRAQLLDEHRFSYDLDSLTGQKLDIIDALAEMFGGKATKNVQMKNLHKAPRDFSEKYACQDIEALRYLYHKQEGQEIPKIHDLEKQVLKVLIKMERIGIRVDVPRAERAVDLMTRTIRSAQKELNELIGKEVNVNSTPQMQELFVQKERKDGILVPKTVGNKVVLIDGTLANMTKKGRASIDAECLQNMSHPAAKLVLKIRKYAKVRDTFLVSQILGHHVNGRVHPRFNQCRVVTGRLSCSDPNLQAIPKRDPEMKAILRPLFLPEDGCSLLRCDYDQSDVRGFAHYISGQSGSEDHPVLKAYRENPDTDFHTFVADLLGIPRNPGPGGGANAKQINLAMIFNMGMGKLAKEMGLPYREEVNKKTGKVYLKPGPEAEEVFLKYHAAIPGAADIGKLASAVAAKRGYVKSIAGRHLRFPDKRFTYKASGYLYQSFTADLIKMAMVKVSEIVVPQLSVHDELIFSITEEEQAWAIRDAMQDAFKDLTKIPIRTQPEVGPNWGQTEPLLEERG